MTEANEAPKMPEVPETTPATPVKRGPGRPKGSGKKAAESQAEPLLRAVATPTPEAAAAGLRQAEWQRLEREARAKRLGVTVDSLDVVESPEENWRESLPEEQPAADPLYAGIYRIVGGHVCMNAGEMLTAKPGTKVRLGAADGRAVTELGIGVRIAD